MHRRTLFAALAVTCIAIGSADARVRGNQQYHQISQAEISQLQRDLTSALGAFREGDHGTRPLSDLTVQIDGPTMVPLEIAAPPGDDRTSTMAPGCWNVLVIPNRLAPATGWVLWVHTFQGAWGLKLGPLFVWNAPNPPQTYFYWIFGYTGCTNNIQVTYSWVRPMQSFFTWHNMVANVGSAGYSYPLVGPGWTIALHGRGDATQGVADSLAVSNAGEAFCDAPFDIVNGNCTGNSIPNEDVDIVFAGPIGNGPDQPGFTVPVMGRFGIAVLVALLGFAAFVTLRRRRTNMS